METDKVNYFHRAGIPEESLNQVHDSARVLTNVQLDLLRIPASVLVGFEPSQIGSIVGALLDACIPQLHKIIPSIDQLEEIGFRKAPGLLKDREGYPDYVHKNGLRVELKLLYKDPDDITLMKKVSTRREPSARLSESVNDTTIIPEKDLMMVLVYTLEKMESDHSFYVPSIVDYGLFPVVECIRARDHRLIERGGKWIGNFSTPVVLSKVGERRLKKGEELDENNYGMKESEGYDYNKETNFGKLKRIPLEPLQKFLKDHGASFSAKGTYPEFWELT